MSIVRSDTICAIATPSGLGGVGVVRVSGPAVKDIAKNILGVLPKKRVATHNLFYSDNNQPIDDGIAIYFAGPNSFTGEDVLELQGHGSPVVLDLLIKRLNQLGARIARPGEFSERAFLNGKMDLAQAEAIADLIESATEQSAQAALRSMQGEFSDKVNLIVEELIKIRMYIESAIDFPEEEIDFLSDSDIIPQTKTVLASLEDLFSRAKHGRLLRDGMTLVLAGMPNVGKSSLLNKLAGYEAAIVTEIAGTTRDLLREHINLDGMPLHVIDTAGIRKTEDLIELEGMRRAWGAIESADRLLLVTEDGTDISAAIEEIHQKLPENMPVTIVRNKIDLTNGVPIIEETPYGTEIKVCAISGDGIDLLINHLKESVGYCEAKEGDFIARRRHLDALTRAQNFIKCGLDQFTEIFAGELLAEDLRQAQQALSEITGEFTSDDLLGKIFSSFCIGK